ncbi:MAG: L-threonylcarbamoyladenylate synthase [Planctomycetota bacterium]|jgi:L-threonylcarbamoyladenylate synthase|nr:L-threonylcarbamoyladenylate synthase [Planctomycetota bacterium]
MASRRVSLTADPATALDLAVETLAGGGVAIFPTDTVYGVGALSGRADAIGKLRRLKGREGADAKPFQFLAADLAMARELGALPCLGAEKLARRFWPGPLTLVVPGADGSGIGIRVPNSPFVLTLCRRLGKALVSSSANPAGQPAPSDADAADAFGDQADLLLDGGRIAGGLPSTVASCLEGELRILRGGGVDPGELFAVWRS